MTDHNQKAIEAAEFAKANTGSDEYWNGLTRTGYGRTPYSYQGERCVAGCKRFAHYETKHHPDCPFYPNSLSKIYDAIAGRSKTDEEKDKEIADLKEQKFELHNKLQTKIADQEQEIERLKSRERELEEALCEVCEDLERMCDGYTGFKANVFASYEKAKNILNKTVKQ